MRDVEEYSVVWPVQLIIVKRVLDDLLIWVAGIPDLPNFIVLEFHTQPAYIRPKPRTSAATRLHISCFSPVKVLLFILDGGKSLSFQRFIVISKLFLGY